jgi:flagellar hook-associated protein 3 FlgL
MGNTMRITNTLFYQNSVNDYQKSMKALYAVNGQMASGHVIQNSYEDSGVYIDAMRLEYQISTLEQVKETTSKAQTFAKNTDKTLNQFSEQLDQFKTKLLQAANAANSTTSLNALADELATIKEGLISLSNTSINGQYLFSGTAFSTKPVSADGTYNGNKDSIQALIGSGVELPYNISGYDLLLSEDNDYNRVVSTNAPMFNQTKLHPETMTNDGDMSEEVYLSETDTIRDMVGDSDADSTNDPDSVFYISGRNSKGETFSSQLQISSSSKVSDLLESIGTEYGNTSTNKVVDVSLNAHGQIEIKDLKQGNSLLDFHMVAAVDRNAASGTTGNALQNDIDALSSQQGVDIISFDKSDFSNLSTTTTVGSREDIYNSGRFYVGYPMSKSDGSEVDATTVLSDFMPSGVDHINVNGTNVAASGTVQDLMNEIETQYGGTARIENGQIIVEGLTTPATLIAEDGTNNPTVGFQIADSMNYTRRSLDKDGNELIGNVSQIIRSNNEFATASTKLVDVAGTNSLNGLQYNLNGVDKNGNEFTAQIDFSNTTPPGSTFSLDGGVTNYTIFDVDGNETAADNMTYQQFLDVASMITSDILPTDIDLPADGIQLDEYNTAIKSAQKNVEATLDYRGRLKLIDTKNSESKIELSISDSNADNFAASSNGSSLSFMANNAVVVEDPYVDFFSDLDDMIEAVRTGAFRMNTQDGTSRNPGIQNSLARLDHIADHVTRQHTKIGAYTNAMTSANERAELLSVNVKTVKSDILDVDIAESYLKFQQLANSYQAMLSTVSSINSMSLLNYM